MSLEGAARPRRAPASPLDEDCMTDEEDWESIGPGALRAPSYAASHVSRRLARVLARSAQQAGADPAEERRPRAAPRLVPFGLLPECPRHQLFGRHRPFSICIFFFFVFVSHARSSGLRLATGARGRRGIASHGKHVTLAFGWEQLGSGTR